MSKHTPGPRVVDDRCVMASDCDWHPVSNCECPASCRLDDEVAANARLIAAAPDLLEALKNLCAAPLYAVDARPELWEEAVAAIAKAEGKA